MSDVIIHEYSDSGFIEQWPNDSGADLDKDSVVVLGDRIGITAAAIADGAAGPVVLTGQVRLPRKTGDAPAVGDVIYWDDTNKELTVTDVGNTRAGLVTVGRSGPGITAQTDTECVDIGV